MRHLGIIGQGNAALRIARMRARRLGDKELVEKITAVLKSGEKSAVAGVALEDEAQGGLLRDILAWIVNNPEEFKALIEWLIGLFSGLKAPADPDSANKSNG